MTQLAPTPDYSSGLPAEVERCSCDEALALQAEVARLNEALAVAEARRHNTEGMREASLMAKGVIEGLVDERTALEARCAELEAELQKERGRRVEHRQQNQALNEANQRLEARCDDLGKRLVEADRRPTLECARRTEQELETAEARRAELEKERDAYQAALLPESLARAKAQSDLTQLRDRVLSELRDPNDDGTSTGSHDGEEYGDLTRRLDAIGRALRGK